MRRLRLLLSASLLTTVAAAGAAPAHAVTIGIADQKADMFHDARFGDLGVRHARINVPYDVISDRNTRGEVDRWMAGARQRGVTPLVTLDRSRRPGRKAVTPSPKALARELKRIRARWPQVRTFATWNEANANKRPETVARQWLALRKACRKCTILGADLLDKANVASWAKRFVKAARRTPAVWGLHNYVDANRFSTKGTRKLLRAVKGRIWLTETGGVVSRRNGSKTRFAGTGPAHAAKATAFLFRKLVPLSPRIQRAYFYHWNAQRDALSWDSGLIDADGNERPALAVLRDQLRRP